MSAAAALVDHVKVKVLAAISLPDGAQVLPTVHQPGETIQIPKAEVDRLVAAGAVEKP